MKKPKKADVELGIATVLVMTYLVILTVAALDSNGALAFWDTCVFALLTYICWRSDREEKARLRRRKAQHEALRQALDELEQWREQREAE